MSVLMNLAIFPTDKGGSVSTFVAEVIDFIRKSGHSYQLTSMSTLVETNTMEEALEVINGSYRILEPHAERVYCNVTMDIRKGRNNCIESKVNAIESKIGKVSR